MLKYPTICINCKHVRTSGSGSLLVGVPLELTCDKGPIVDFVIGTHESCKKRNQGGVCPDFEPVDPAPAPVSAEVN